LSQTTLEQNHIPSKLFIPVFSLFLIISGYCSVSYEILWFRSLHLLLGSDSLAIALVLSSFMAGLGVGSWWLGKAADRISPSALYRWLELGIGLYACITPWLLSFGSIPYRFIFQSLEGHTELLLLFKFLLSFVVLFIPTFLMGGTLPTAVRILTKNFEIRSGRIAKAYGLNTLGACLSAVLVPFLLLPSLDQHWVLAGTICGNLFIFLGMFLFSPSQGKQAIAYHENLGSKSGMRLEKSFLSWTLFLTGFVSLGLETVWNRLFSLHMTSSIYTFSLILALYLAAVGFGSLLMGLRPLKNGNQGRIFAFTQLIISFLIIIQVMIIDKVTWIQLWLLDMGGVGFGSYMLTNALVITLMTGPINLLFGLSFPSALTYLTSDPERLGRKTGALAAINTLGTATASIVVTFFFYSILGSKITLLILGLLSLSCFFIISRSIQFPKRNLLVIIILGLIVVALLFPWKKQNFHLLMAQKPDWALEMYRKDKLQTYRDQIKILSFLEGREAVVSACILPEGVRTLFINGKPDASDYSNDKLSQYLSGHLPFLYYRKSNPPEVLVLGLGSGSSTYAAFQHDVASIETIEISPEVIQCARKHFTELNHNVAMKTPIRLADARNILHNTNKRYDIIISEPSNPWITGVSNLFTTEFFKDVDLHLKEDGIFCQWFYYYKLNYEHVLGMVSTLRSVFPHINAYSQAGDIFLIASKSKLQLDESALMTPSSNTQTLIKQMGFSNSSMVTNYFLWNEEQIHKIETLLPVNRDGRSWLEFEAPKYIFGNYSDSNLSKFIDTAPSSILPLSVKPTITSSTLEFHPIGINLPHLQGLSLNSFCLERHTFISKDIIQNAFWVARFSDKNGGTMALSSPVLERDLNFQTIQLLLKGEMKGWLTAVPVKVTLPDRTYLAFVDEGPPFRWTGLWKYHANGQYYILTVDSLKTINDRISLVNYLNRIRYKS